MLDFFSQAENCADAEVIYRFLEANEIGQNHSFYYCAYALLMESKNKLKKADEMFNLGIARSCPTLTLLTYIMQAYHCFF